MVRIEKYILFLMLLLNNFIYGQPNSIDNNCCIFSKSKTVEIVWKKPMDSSNWHYLIYYSVNNSKNFKPVARALSGDQNSYQEKIELNKKYIYKIEFKYTDPIIFKEFNIFSNQVSCKLPPPVLPYILIPGWRSFQYGRKTEGVIAVGLTGFSLLTLYLMNANYNSTLDEYNKARANYLNKKENYLNYGIIEVNRSYSDWEEKYSEVKTKKNSVLYSSLFVAGTIAYWLVDALFFNREEISHCEEIDLMQRTSFNYQSHNLNNVLFTLSYRL